MVAEESFLLQKFQKFLKNSIFPAIHAPMMENLTKNTI
jgi:hypothetical protein